jgi:hypothetical protein
MNNTGDHPSSFARPDRFADDVENAKRNMVIDLMNFGRTEGEAARELEQLIRASRAHSD